MIFRCKNCGGNVVYSPERKKMFCPFCESEDSEEREDGVIETSGEENGTAEGTVQAAGAGQPVSRMVAAEGAAQKKVTKVCPNCGGEIPMTVNTSATQCPYCDNYVIVDDQISGAYTPHMLIPFHMGKEVCKKLIRDKFEKCIFSWPSCWTRPAAPRWSAVCIPAFCAAWARPSMSRTPRAILAWR